MFPLQLFQRFSCRQILSNNKQIANRVPRRRSKPRTASTQQWRPPVRCPAAAATAAATAPPRCCDFASPQWNHSALAQLLPLAAMLLAPLRLPAPWAALLPLLLLMAARTAPLRRRLPAAALPTPPSQRALWRAWPVLVLSLLVAAPWQALPPVVSRRCAVRSSISGGRRRTWCRGFERGRFTSSAAWYPAANSRLATHKVPIRAPFCIIIGLGVVGGGTRRTQIAFDRLYNAVQCRALSVRSLQHTRGQQAISEPHLPAAQSQKRSF